MERNEAGVENIMGQSKVLTMSPVENRKPCPRVWTLFCLARPRGFEPLAPRLGKRSPFNL